MMPRLDQTRYLFHSFMRRILARTTFHLDFRGYFLFWYYVCHDIVGCSLGAEKRLPCYLYRGCWSKERGGCVYNCLCLDCSFSLFLRRLCPLFYGEESNARGKHLRAKVCDVISRSLASSLGFSSYSVDSRCSSGNSSFELSSSFFDNSSRFRRSDIPCNCAEIFLAFII